MDITLKGLGQSYLHQIFHHLSYTVQKGRGNRADQLFSVFFSFFQSGLKK